MLKFRSTSRRGLGVAIGLVAAISLAVPAQAVSAPAARTSGARTEAKTPPPPRFQTIDFDHAVSLPNAAKIKTAFQAPVLGYHFESDSTVGDYWTGTNQSLDQFMAEMERLTGSEPEVVGAYVDPKALAPSAQLMAGAATKPKLATGFPQFKAKPGKPTKDFKISDKSKAEDAGQTAAPMTAMLTNRWDPSYAEVQILDLGTTVNMIEKYSWVGPPDTSVYYMPDHWGMEFTVDFWTTMRTPPPGYVPPPTYGYRPWCGWADYKDWAAASNDVFSWFAMVLDGHDFVYAPGSIGFYGDYNDLSDQCTRSSVSVGMAAPWQMPFSSLGTNDVLLALYPDRGQDAISRLDANVQAVERYTCETLHSTPLTDCMGADTSINWPGPGSDNRGVLAYSRDWLGPDACWTSRNYGADAPISWACDQGE